MASNEPFPPLPPGGASDDGAGGVAAEACDVTSEVEVSSRVASCASEAEGSLGGNPGGDPALGVGHLALPSRSALPSLGAASVASARRHLVEPSSQGRDSEDNPLADLLGSESQWWNQVRDATNTAMPAGPVDPLEGRPVDFAAALRSACQLTSVPSGLEDLKQPWETGVFGFIFGGQDFLDFPARRFPQIFIPGEEDGDAGASESSAKRLKPSPTVLSFSKVVRSRAVVDWKQQRSAQWDIGLHMWLDMVLQWGPCLLVSHLEACVTRQDQLEVLSDTFKGKAPSTILKRARSLSALHAFLKGRGATFPCAEEDVYAFLKQLQRDEAPVSRISAVLEALNFTWHVVGVCELESSCKSRRCKGLGVTECFAEAKQAAALTVKQLFTLHEALEGHADPWTRLFAGAALTCAYARCRWSDVQHSETIIWDLNDDLDLAYIELRIGMHKTCRLQSKRHRFLHAVAPALGLRPYGKIWRECREQLGVTDSGSCPFMPAPDAQGRATIRALDSDEATAWLRLLLGPGDGGRTGFFEVS